MQKLQWLALIFVTVVLSACATNRDRSPDERRAAVQSMKNEVLSELYRVKQSAQAEVSAAPGYGVFSNANINVILASFGGGYGVVHNNATATDTYMNMGEVGIGLGAGVKDYRLVFVFHNASALNNFVTHGWSFGGQADAAAKAGDKGAAVGGEAILDGVSVYQLTESGLALQATIKGTKYWRNSDLN